VGLLSELVLDGRQTGPLQARTGSRFHLDADSVADGVADPVPQYNGPVEREARFRAVSLHELVNGVPVPALGIEGGQAVLNSRFRLVQIWKTQNGLGRRAAFLSRVLLSHGFAVLPTANRSCSNPIDGLPVIRPQSGIFSYVAGKQPVTDLRTRLHGTALSHIIFVTHNLGGNS
jgi:hypothetical protein